jgi:hypothetical protein
MLGLAADILKWLQMVFTVIGLLGIFFTFIVYNIIIIHDEASREAFILGNAVLSSDCIIDDTKGLFIESKLDSVDPLCFNYDKGEIEITIPETGQTWNFNLGGSSTGATSPLFNVMVKLDVTGGDEVKMGRMVVII